MPANVVSAMAIDKLLHPINCPFFQKVRSEHSAWDEP